MQTRSALSILGALAVGAGLWFALNSSPNPPAAVTAQIPKTQNAAPIDLNNYDFGRKSEVKADMVWTIQYRDRNGKLSERDIKPIAIYRKNTGQVYIEAYCLLRGENRHFRLDRIQSLTANGKTYSSRNDILAVVNQLSAVF